LGAREGELRLLELTGQEFRARLPHCGGLGLLDDVALSH